eukprot:TRINITY_DN1583_c0_g1_i1.p1 TRINITY_DN1583_c0_g1~~TRINITY_DN1583_c0_g1_i1.p1  ORF type:complete len:340 (-),score=67.85 TRINITY_DN1583_c0_g1_i1:324-1343(-)
MDITLKVGAHKGYLLLWILSIVGAVVATVHFVPMLNIDAKFDINIWQALVYCALCTLVFVGFFYLPPKSIRRLSRDHPKQIKYRTFGVMLTCIICLSFIWYFGTQSNKIESLGWFSWTESKDNTMLFFEWIGVRKTALIPALTHPIILTLVLFLGPLVEKTLSLRRFSDIFMSMKSFSLLGLRNLFVSPLAEEIVFRCCMVPVLFAATQDVVLTIVISPVFFGVAHLHHIFDMVWNESVGWGQAFQLALFQMGYCMLFGALQAFLFLRTGHAAVMVIMHILCNFFGFPTLSFGDVSSPLYKFRHGLYLLHALGLIAFFAILMPLTDPSKDLFESQFWNQ